MYIIVDKHELDVENIRLNKNLKIIYNYKDIQLLGLPIKIKFLNCEIFNNYIKLYLSNESKKIMDKIDNFLSRLNYSKVLNNNELILKKNKQLFLNNNILYINLCGLKKNDNILYLNINIL